MRTKRKGQHQGCQTFAAGIRIPHFFLAAIQRSALHWATPGRVQWQTLLGYKQFPFLYYYYYDDDKDDNDNDDDDHNAGGMADIYRKNP